LTPAARQPEGNRLHHAGDHRQRGDSLPVFLTGIKHLPAMAWRMAHHRKNLAPKNKTGEG
jgi:hypothetical protein